jgi:predicted dehydrogenase
LSELRVAIIGCGKIADRHADQIRRVPNCRLVSVCDREKLMADQLAERFGVDRSYDDVDKLLEETRPNVVHITTPPQSHFELTTKCLKAGCNVYVEKPFSVNLQEARAMVTMAQEYGLKITAGHNYQFSPEMIRMRELMRTGILGGPPVHIESVFSYGLEDDSYVSALIGDEKHWVRALPGKLLQNVISHGIAKIIEFFVTSEVTVSATGYASSKLRSMGTTDMLDELRVVLSDSEKTTAYFTFTTQISPPVQELRVFGPKGSIVVDGLHRTAVGSTCSNSVYKSYLNYFIPPIQLARQYTRNTWSNLAAFLKADFHVDAGMKNLIQAFYRSIQFGDPLPISYREVLLTTAVMDEIFRQVSVGENVFVSGTTDRSTMVIPGARI